MGGFNTYPDGYNLLPGDRILVERQGQTLRVSGAGVVAGAVETDHFENYKTYTDLRVSSLTNQVNTLINLVESLTSQPILSLNTLYLSTTAMTAGTLFHIGIVGQTAGSTVTAIASDGTVLDASNGLLSGTFTTSGAKTVTLTETLAGAFNSPNSVQITVGVSTAPIVVPLTITGTPAAAVVGQGAAFTPTISGGTAPYTLSLLSGTLPAGRSLSGASVVGTYTTAGAFSYTLRATDAVGATANLPVSGTVTSATAPILAARALTTDINNTSPMMASTPAAFSFIASPAGKQIVVDTTQLDTRPWLGVGSHITDGTAQVLLSMPQAARTALLTRVFGTDGHSVLRIAFSDNDFTPAYTASGKPFKTYDDTDVTATDATLPNFSIAQDKLRIIPVLKEILAINPNVEFIASSWTPPAFMKTTGVLTGGALIDNADNLNWYATYYLKALQAYKAEGITINRITMQNEPNNSQTDYPTCTMNAGQLAYVIQITGAKLAANGYGYVKILSGDCAYNAGANRDTYPLTETNAKQYVSGVAYHGYNATGTASVMEATGKAYPTTELHMTENSFSNGGTEVAIKTRLASARYGRDVPRAGGQSIVWFCLALAPGGQPGPNYNLSSPVIVNTDGSYTLWPEYYMLGHIGRYVARGARRCFSTEYDSNYTTNPDNDVNFGPKDVQSVAWVNPDGTVVVYLVNGGSTDQTVSVIDQAAGNISTSVLVPTKGMATVNFKNAAAAATAPLAPQVTVTAAVNGYTVALTKNAPANGGSAITGYTIRVGGAVVATNVALPYTGTAAPGTAISVDAAAVNAQGTSGYSTAQSVTPTSSSTPLSITGTPASANVGSSAVFTPTIAGGTAPYTLALQSGTLPAGRSLSGLTVTGTYTTAASYSYVLRATDSVGATATLSLTETVSATVAAPAHYLNMSGANSEVYSTNLASLDPANGYLETGVWAALTSYTASVGAMSLQSRWNPSGGANNSHQFFLTTTGALAVYYTDQGGTFRSPAASTVTIPSLNPDANLGISMQAAINLGTSAVTSPAIKLASTGAFYSAPPATCTYFTSTDQGATWTQLGDVITGLVGTGFKQSGTANPAFTVGGIDGTASRNSSPQGKMFKTWARDATRVLANPNFTAQATGATTFQDTATTPNTFTIYQSTIA